MRLVLTFCFFLALTLLPAAKAQEEEDPAPEDPPAEEAPAEEAAAEEAAPEEAPGEEAPAAEEAPAEEAAAAEEAPAAEAEAPAEEAAAAEEEAAPAAAEGEAAEAPAAEGEKPKGEGGAEAEGEAEAECETVTEESADDEIASILALEGKKCKPKAVSGSEELAAALETCNMDGMDEKLAGCLEGHGSRIKTLEQAVLSGEGGGLEDQITLVLVKKGVVDCDNDTQCADDRACLDSYKERGRKMCELPCERVRCDVPHSECIAANHEAKCECKEEFHGNGTELCVPNGFTEETNGKHYRMFDEEYVDWENATQKCRDLAARLPVLDKQETIDVIKKYLETSNFTVFEQWDRSSRRVWLGLVLDRAQGLVWADGARVATYPASSRMFVWEARRMLSQEVPYADSSRHYALYIDGDIAKLPGGGRKGAAVLCELIPESLGTAPAYDPYSDPRHAQQSYVSQRQAAAGHQRDGGYPNYPQERRS